MAENFISKVAKVNAVNLYSHNGKGADILGNVLEINLFESIYLPNFTGTLEILDSFDMPQFFPIIGEETLDIDISLPSIQDDANMMFKGLRVYKITDRRIIADKTQTYKLWFISPEVITNHENKICKSWSQKTTDRMVKDVFSVLKSDKTFNVESTIGAHNYISTNFSPFQVLNYLASHRSINTNKLSDFVFFENFDLAKKTTKFNFTSLNTLCASAPVASLTYHPVIVNNPSVGNVQPHNVTDIAFSKGFDIIESKMSGMYNQTYIYYDLLRKKYVVQKNKFDDVFNESKAFRIDGSASAKTFVTNTDTPGEFVNLVFCKEFPNRISLSQDLSNTNNSSTERRATRGTNTWINNYGTVEDKSSSLVEKTLYRRNILLQEFEINKIFINELSGNYKYTVGSTVEFNKPHLTIKKEKTKEEYNDQYDRYISGKYLIMKTIHIIKLGDSLNWIYKTSLEVSKNSFKKAIE